MKCVPCKGDKVIFDIGDYTAEYGVVEKIYEDGTIDIRQDSGRLRKRNLPFDSNSHTIKFDFSRVQP